MKSAHSRATLLNLDVLALALLCCLLASVVGVLVLGDEEKHTGPCPICASLHKKECDKSCEHLRQQIAKFSGQVQEIERAREGSVTKLNHAILERDNHTLKSRIENLEAIIDFTKKIDAVKAESTRLAKELAKLAEKEKTTRITAEAKRMLGEYKGTYILVECVQDQAVIYPGKQTIAMEPSKEQTERLLSQIVNAGFVAFVVRPAGWYDNSYDRLKKLIYGELDNAEKQGGKRVGRSIFPLDANDSIANYLPPDRAQ